MIPFEKAPTRRDRAGIPGGAGRPSRIVRLAACVCAAGLWAQAIAAPGSFAGTRLYDNTGNPANTYYAGQGGSEAIDDVHMVSGGTLDTLVFEYHDPALGGTFSATVNIYNNAAGLDLAASPFAGPYIVNSLPRGRGVVSIALPQLQITTANLWIGVRFSSTTAGLILNDDPAAGSSHDLYLENGDFFWFGGTPRANFGLRLIGRATSVAVGEGPDLARVALAPAQPNPFRADTRFTFSINQRGPVRLDVLDVSGRRVRALVNEVRDAGRYTERWSGRDDAGRVANAGVYFVRLEAGATVTMRRVAFTP